jgi:transcription antitermination factor NusG
MKATKTAVLPMSLSGHEYYTRKHWFVLRDLKRTNANDRAYLSLARYLNKEVELFTPMAKRTITQKGKKVLVERPFIADLLFVRESKQTLDPVIESIATLQYRYMKGCSIDHPMTVRDDTMDRFMQLINAEEKYVYYTPEEVPPEVYGKRIRIVGGPLDGFEGRLMSKRGSKSRKLLVDLDGLLSVGVEVTPEYIQLLKE